MDPGKARPEGSILPLVIRFEGQERRLPAGIAYRVGRDPESDVVIADARVSRRHAELSFEEGRWVLADNGSANGTFLEGRRVNRVEIGRHCLVRLGHPADGVVLLCSVDAMPAPPAEAATRAATDESPAAVPRPAATTLADDGGTIEIPYAIRWLVPKGERFANFDILNDNDTQLDYYRRFGHIYAVGVPTKKWRLVVVSDPVLLDEVAANEDQFGKRVEEINFFAQLSNSRGGGISVIGDGEHYDKVRRVMLPWYAPANQRTQLNLMKEQARNLVAAWAAIPDGEPVDARTWMERYALEVSGRGACNYNFGLFDSDGQPPPFAVAVPESTKESIRRVADPSPDFTLFAGRGIRERRRRYREQNEELFRTAEALVRARRQTRPAGQPTDLLSRLVTTPDPETGELLDAETVRDQVLMHLSNGFNGPSITGAWLAFTLATQPDVEERLLAEVDRISGGDPDYDLRYDDLPELTYTTQVIKETMRVYPPMPVSIRRSLRDGTLGRYRVRKGDIILVGTLAAQRDPRYWGPDPDRFDPGQFELDKVLERPRHAFIPFSVGRRQCMAQEVTFMMLRVAMFEICKHYRLRLAPGATVVKNTVVTTKPAAVPIIRLPRTPDGRSHAPVAARDRPAAGKPAAGPGWGKPTEIPATSDYRHLVIAYGSNFGANKDLAERFAERSQYQGYSTDVMTLNNLAESPPRRQPWLLVVMTSTYTSNPPSNAAAFKRWLDRSEPGSETWRNCRYLVWGLGNSQWNAFLAFPRYVYKKLADLGAAPLADFAYADVGSPIWERQHADWNALVWPLLLKLSGARETDEAAARIATEAAASGALTGADSSTAMFRSLQPGAVATPAVPKTPGVSMIMRRMSSVSWRRGASSAGSSSVPIERTQPRIMLSPTILTNAAGQQTLEARVQAWRELQAPGSPRRTRHLEISLPPGVGYLAGDHIGICPKNDEDRVERLARHLGAAPDGLFRAPKTVSARAVPAGVVLQVRNVLTNLVDITARPTAPMLDLMLAKVTDPGEWSRLAEIRDVVGAPDGPASPVRAAVDAGGYDILRLLDEFPSCSLNIFEFLQVVQPLKPRYYSPSSSPLIHGEGIAHLTVSLEAAEAPGLPDHEFYGMSSRYLHSLREGDRLNVFIDSASGFHLQEDVSKPMIFICAGTGFAPMRAFLWERLARKHAGVTLGQAVLFNGIRSPGLDYIYREEIERFAADGVLDHVHVAASRERPGSRQYVQDLLAEQGALVWRLLAAGGYVYVCGRKSMRDAIRAAIVSIAATNGSLSGQGAAAYVQELEMAARYRPDLWG